MVFGVGGVKSIYDACMVSYSCVNKMVTIIVKSVHISTLFNLNMARNRYTNNWSAEAWGEGVCRIHTNPLLKS